MVKKNKKVKKSKYDGEREKIKYSLDLWEGRMRLKDYELQDAKDKRNIFRVKGETHNKIFNYVFVLYFVITGLIFLSNWAGLSDTPYILRIFFLLGLVVIWAFYGMKYRKGWFNEDVLIDMREKDKEVLEKEKENLNSRLELLEILKKLDERKVK